MVGRCTLSNAPVFEKADPDPHTARRREQPIGLSGWQQGAAFLLACAILISRRPEAVFHAQFRAEDGYAWFADAYNLGWLRALFYAHDGYFQTFPRLGAALALLAPLWLAPLVMNLAALAAEALPVNLLLSSRSSAWGSLRFRTLLAVVYLALPDRWEIGFGITESQWLLALSAFLVLVAAAPGSKVSRYFNLLIFLLSGLSGPFCIFLLPIAAFLAWKWRERWRWERASVIAACSLVQAFSLLVLDTHVRPHYTLGASPAMFTRLLGGNVILGVLLGPTPAAARSGTEIFLFLFCLVILGAGIVAACFFKSAVEMKLLLVFTGMLLAASLLSPVAYPPAGSTVWDMLARAAGVRYWFFPSLAFAWALLWGARRGNALLKPVSIFLIFLVCLGAARNWGYPALDDLHFADYAKSFESAPPGTVMIIPINPEGCRIRLVKHSSR